MRTSAVGFFCRGDRLALEATVISSKSDAGRETIHAGSRVVGSEVHRGRAFSCSQVRVEGLAPVNTVLHSR